MFTESELDAFKKCDLNAFKRWFKTLKKATSDNVSLEGFGSFKDAVAGLEVYVVDKDFVRVVLTGDSNRAVNLLHEDLSRMIKVSSK